MHRRITVLLVLLLVGATASAALAATKPTAKKHKFKATIQLGSITTGANFPAVGGTVTDAGIVRSTPGGKGAEIDTLKVTAAPSPTSLTLAGTATIFYTNGSETAKATIKVAVAPDGSAAYTGSGKFTKGSGIYKGVTGKFTVTGSSSSATAITTLSVTGTATY
jgi:hypothetical protein